LIKVISSTCRKDDTPRSRNTNRRGTTHSHGTYCIAYVMPPGELPVNNPMGQATLIK
jgi:hypothetical protein